MDPRISFSNDFVDTKFATNYESSYREAPVSTDFEFNVKKYSMIPADEIFFKGMVLPLKENCTTQMRKMTLRDELLVDEDVFPKVTKGNSGWWKDRLGLKRAHNLPKKSDQSHDIFGNVDQIPAFVHEGGSFTTKRIKEVLNGE